MQRRIFRFCLTDFAGCPCVAVYIDKTEGHMWEAEFYYGTLHLSLWIFGNKDFVGRDKLQEMIDCYDRYAFNCLSEDSILFSLRLLGAHEPNDILMEKLRTELSPILISKEKLQEIAGQK